MPDHRQPDLPRSKSTHLPRAPSTNLDSFPIPRTKSVPRLDIPTDKPAASSAPPVPVPSLDADAQDDSALRPPSVAPIPPPKSDDDAYSLTGKRHLREFSIDSKSSYRTSFASSSHYGDGSNRWTAMSSRRPSMASVAVNPFMDDAPPLPPAPSRYFQSHSRQDSSVSSNVAAGEDYTGFDFAIPADTNSYRDEIERSGYSPFRDSSQPSSRGSTDLFPRTPSHSPFGGTSLPDLPEERSPPTNHYPSSHLLPPGQEPTAHSNENHAARKNSDANSESPISVSNFARALGLDAADSTAESSVASSDISQFDTRSGTSLSSLPSEASLSRRKPSDLGKLGPVVEEQQPESQGQLLGEQHQTESPIDLEPPPAPLPLFSPDSPTDPAIFQGSLSLVPSSTPNIPRSPPELPPTRSATVPPSNPSPEAKPPSKPAPRPKGPCRGCGEMIKGKSVSSADGRLTGRYHRACFVCYYCYVPFQTADFYVLGDRPYCAQHYHELNGSLCSTCYTGIEGQYLETIERRGRGVADRQKFHPECLRCRACQVVLKGDYYEWNGQVFCERDAYRAVSAPPPVSPQRPRRPTLPSPLSQSHQYPPPSPDGRRGLRPGPLAPGPGPGRRSPAPYYPLPSPGPRRFPERRTTRLMMT